jgi:hypothetical protein
MRTSRACEHPSIPRASSQSVGARRRRVGREGPQDTRPSDPRTSAGVPVPLLDGVHVRVVAPEHLQRRRDTLVVGALHRNPRRTLVRHQVRGAVATPPQRTGRIPATPSRPVLRCWGGGLLGPLGCVVPRVPAPWCGASPDAHRRSPQSAGVLCRSRVRGLTFEHASLHFTNAARRGRPDWTPGIAAQASV